MKKLLYCILTMALACGIANTATAKPIVFKLNTFFGATNAVAVNYIGRVPEILEKKSNGQLKLEVYYSDSLGKSSDAFKYLKAGLFDMAYVWACFHPGETPDLVYPSDYPGLTNSRLWNKWFYASKDSYGEIVNPLYEAYGLKVLGYQAQVGSSIVYSRKPIRGLGDMKGLIARRVGFGSIDAVFSGLGIATVAVTPVEIYEALQRGTIDIGVATVEGYHDFKWYEPAKYALLAGWFNWVSSYVMRKEAFDALPKDLQKILSDSFREAQDVFHGKFVDIRDEALAKLKKLDINPYELSRSDMTRLDQLQKKYTDSFEEKYPSWAPRFRKASELYDLRTK